MISGKNNLSLTLVIQDVDNQVSSLLLACEAEQPQCFVLQLHKCIMSVFFSCSHEGTEPESVSDNLVVTLSSFTGKFVVIHVAKRPGMEDVELLASDDDAGESDDGEADDGEPAEDGYWDSLTG